MSLTQAEVLVRTSGLSHDEWLANRRKGIGGSDIGAICGVNPWKSPLSVYLDKIGELPPVEENDAMHFGTLLEPVVADEYKRRTGYAVQRRNFMYQHPDYPWALANVDRIILNKQRGHGILEVKTASEFQSKEWSEGIVPEQYILQLQWYLWITGFQWGAFAVLVGGNKFYSHEMERNEDIIGYMVESAKEFWERVETRNPPPIDGSADSTKILSALYPQSRPDSSTTLPNEAAEWIRMYREALDNEKAAKEQKELAVNKLKAMMRDNEIARYGDHKITWKSHVQQDFDKKAFANEHPELFAKYASNKTIRKFLVK
ncbi:YqaJ viral recombinase family nuclease [Alicyclobacillus dauci]|uniref:YqaJ viral recombinase family protein n=1 Tax=Alicyclobacillus dauci TaxID=1475485 RepID=A0ABY6YWV2_9BACL|nr:YqaJ viral recombinase family protein [Alicyclobacillus dauci]WAH35010.1 YqaJ viral recombinase family protein [Alicyclobacillus dauci]